MAYRQRFMVDSTAIPVGVQILGNTKIDKGAGLCVEDGVGYARNCANGLTTPVFLGFAEDGKDNTGGANGGTGKPIRAIPYGFKRIPPGELAGGTGIADVNAEVFMDGAHSFTLTSTGNVKIGRVFSYWSNEGWYVWFESPILASS